jgi:TPR repeat protein
MFILIQSSLFANEVKDINCIAIDAFKRSDPSSIKLLQEACDKGYGQSCGNLGYSYSQGVFIEKNIKLAKKYLKKGCDLDSGFSCSNLAYVYRHQDSNFDQLDKDNVAYLEKILKKSCDLKSAQGCYQLGSLYKMNKGWTLTSKIGLASEYLKKGCSYGFKMSCEDLDELTKKLNKQEEDRKNCEKTQEVEVCYSALKSYTARRDTIYDTNIALKLGKNTCTNFFAKGCWKLGNIYIKENNIEKAIQMYSTGCDNNEKYNCSSLGSLILKKDKQKGQKILTYSCEKNNNGCHDLAQSYYDDKKFDLALKYFDKSCNGRYSRSDSCFAMAKMYYNAKGITKNVNKAKQLSKSSCTYFFNNRTKDEQTFCKKLGY